MPPPWCGRRRGRRTTLLVLLEFAGSLGEGGLRLGSASHDGLDHFDHDILLAEQPTWAPFLDGIEFGGPEPLLTDYVGLQNVMIEMVQSVVTGQAEPQDALTKAAGELEQYK